MTSFTPATRWPHGAPRALIAALALLAAASVSAKTLVYCSGGQPRELLPGGQHDRHVVRRQQPDLQPHRRLRARRHHGRAGAGRALGHLPRRQGLHVPPAQGREVAQPPRVEADARLQCRRHDLRDRAAVEGIQSVLQGDELEPLVLQRHGPAQAAEVGGEGRRLHGPDHAREARGAVPVRPRDGIRRRAVQGVRRRDAQGRHAGEDRPGADRHRSVLPGAVPEGRDPPLQGVPAVLGRQGQDRRPRVLDHAGRVGALGQAAEGRVPRDAVPESRPTSTRSARIRTSRCSSSRGSTSATSPTTRPRSRSTTCACARPSTWRSTRRPSSTPCTSRPACAAKNPIPPTQWSYNDAIKDDPYDPAAAKKLLADAGYPERLHDRPVGDAGAAPVQPQRATHRRADAGRPRQGRRHGRDQELRMGRVPQAHAERRAPDGHAGLDRRQRRSRTTSWPRCSVATPRRATAATSPSSATSRTRT